MSSAREDVIIVKFQNNIEYMLFIKDGVVNDELLEQIEKCQSEPSEIFGTKTMIFHNSVSEVV